MLVFLEADLDDVAEKLRHHTAKTTRIEIAPWAKAYTVDIKDIYTELSLEKIENQPTWPEGQRIEDYKELFAECRNELQEQESGSTPQSMKPRPSRKFWRRVNPVTAKRASQRKSTGTGRKVSSLPYLLSYLYH